MHVNDTYFRPKAAVVEASRCLVFLMLFRFGPLKPLISSLSFAFEVSKTFALVAYSRIIHLLLISFIYSSFLNLFCDYCGKFLPVHPLTKTYCVTLS